MNYRKLGMSGIKVSEISLGCWTMGGPSRREGYATGYADVNEDDIREAILYALENGVNHFDNADCYGDGKAERMLAKILGKKSKDVIISSKVGHFKGTAENAYEPSHIRHQCEQSLINLKREYIDIYYFHHGNFGKNDKYLDDAINAMNNLKKEGKIRIIGLSAYSSSDFERLLPKIKPDVLQSWAHIMDDKFITEGSIVRNLLEKNNLSFVAFSPLNQGLLLDKFKPGNPPIFEEGDHRKDKPKFSKEALEKLAPKMEKLKERFGSETKELARIALQYVLYHQVVGCVIPGFRNKNQVDINLSAQGKELSEEDIKYIKHVFNNL
ncbi:MAG: aldo/keto reductase [Elusimicrobiota bacterium]